MDHEDNDEKTPKQEGKPQNSQKQVPITDDQRPKKKSEKTQNPPKKKYS
jgi:hypothetical protein